LDERAVSPESVPGPGGLAERASVRLPRLPLRGQHYKVAYFRLAQRDGESCQGCGTTQGPLQIHHKDGDTWNNALWNLELRCAACNTGENNRLRTLGKPSSREHVCVSEEAPESRGMRGEESSDNLVLYSQRLQRDCWHWIMTNIGPGATHIYLTLREAVNTCSYDIGSHPTTVRRYFDMFATSNGPIRIEEKVLPGDRPGRRTRIVVYVGSKLLPGEGKDPDPKELGVSSEWVRRSSSGGG
jgi:hypothetical protein